MVVWTEKMIFPDRKPAGLTVLPISGKSLEANAERSEVMAICCCRATAIRAAAIDFPSLKLIQLTSAGFDHVPLQTFANRGILVCNAGNTYSIPIAETIVYGMLQLVKRYYRDPRIHILRPFRNYHFLTELAGKRVLILGAGSIGTEVARRLNAFDMLIDGYDPYCPEKPPYRRISRTREALLAELGDYDFVISTLPDTPETSGFLDGEVFSRMNATAHFINVGRRAVIREAELYRALKSRQLGGAVLDMFEKVPNPITNPFRRLSNVIVLPGVSAISREAAQRLQALLEKNITAILTGEVPDCIVNRKAT